MRRGPRLTLEEIQPYLVPETDPPTLLDLPGLFGNPNPVELEVGFGKGLFLIRSAQERPDVNFLGIEIVRKYQLLAATRIAVRKLPNIKVTCSDAKVFVKERIPSGSLDTVHVYFPDPWWKTRHHKRRLFTTEFAKECIRMLRIGGLLSFATDVEDYFAMVKGVVAVLPQLHSLPTPQESKPVHDMDYLTNFERKFRKEGRPIYRARWSRRDSQA